MIHIYPINRDFPGQPLTGEQKHAKLYHYTSFETFVRIWLSKRLKFGDIKNVNDINECNKTFSSSLSHDYINTFSLMKDIRNEIESYKQISLSMDFDTYKKGCMSPIMWGYYGKKKGVCIELDFDKIVFENSMLFKKIKYVKHLKESHFIPPSLNGRNIVNKYVLKNKNEIFFTKLNDWKGENEFRIISKIDNFLDISKAISAIYITNNDSQECLFIEELVGKSIPVEEFYYEMSNGIKIPNIRNAKSRREILEYAKNDPTNVLNTF